MIDQPFKISTTLSSSSFNFRFQIKAHTSITLPPSNAFKDSLIKLPVVAQRFSYQQQPYR